MRKAKNERFRFISWLFQSWWMAVLLFVTFGLYAKGMSRKDAVLKRLAAKVTELQNSIQIAQAEKKQYESELASLDDPEWVELVLMRKLGVVPERQTKVFFK